MTQAMLVRTTDAVYEIEDGWFRRDEEGWRTFDLRGDVAVGRPLRFYWADDPSSGSVRMWSTTPVVAIVAA